MSPDGFKSHHRHQAENPHPIWGCGFFLSAVRVSVLLSWIDCQIFRTWNPVSRKKSGHESGHKKPSNMACLFLFIARYSVKYFYRSFCSVDRFLIMLFNTSAGSNPLYTRVTERKFKRYVLSPATGEAAKERLLL